MAQFSVEIMRLPGSVLGGNQQVQNNHYQIKNILGLNTDAKLVWFALEAGLVDEQVGAGQHPGPA